MKHFPLIVCIYTYVYCNDPTVFIIFIICLQNKESRSVSEKLSSLETSYSAESERMRGELTRLRGFEEEAKNKTNQVSSLLEELEKLRKELSTTQQEKKTIEDWAQNYRNEMEKVRQESTSFSVCTGVLNVPLSATPPTLVCDFSIHRCQLTFQKYSF